MLSRLLILAASVVSLMTSAMAQDYPSRPIKVVIPFGAGTGGDVFTRMMLDQMQTDTGATFVVDNRAGALSIIGTQAVMRAPADGYTILMSSSSSHSLATSLSKDATYDPVKDFTHIAIAQASYFGLIVPAESKNKTVADLMADLKANPGKLRWGYASAAAQVTMVKFLKLTGTDAVGVPYRSSQDTLNDLYGGRLDMLVIDQATTASVAKTEGGKGRVLLLMADKKSAMLPSIPSLKEANLPTLGLVGWSGFAGPAGMPAAAKDWFAKALAKALANPELVKKLANLAIEPADIPDANKFVADQLASWSQATKEAGLTPQ